MLKDRKTLHPVIHNGKSHTPNKSDTPCIIKKISAPMFDIYHNLIDQCHVMMYRNLFASQRHTQIPERGGGPSLK